MTAGAPHGPDVAGMLDEQLRCRIADALAALPELIGDVPGTGAEIDVSQLHDVIETLVQRLVAAGDAQAAETQAAHRQQLERLRQRFEERVDALARVHHAIARLREITAPAAMLEAAARAVSESADLDRVVVSTVRDGTMTAETVHVRDDPDGAKTTLEALRAHPTRLEHPLIETEILRRRRATVVADAHVHPRVDRRMAEVMGWRTYVAAPVAVRGNVIAMIHADRGAASPLDALRRDLLWEFAAGLAQAYESASLRRTLRHERDRMHQFVAWLDARSGELSDAAIELVPDALGRVLPPEPLDVAAASPARDDGSAFEGLLTRRELEVLRLLADGRANRAIADELVISGGTVKFHVNSILRKLHAANRAEAVSRYYALRDTGHRER